MTGWDLPESVAVGGKEYQINADYRDILDIISRLNDTGADEQTRIYVSLALFYADFGDMPESDYNEAVQRLFWFMNCGEVEENARPRPKTIDWDQDQAMIVADINKVAGCEVRALPFCHWWTFMAWFNGVGEGQLSTVVSIREKLRRGKKLAEWERDFYRMNREKVDLKIAVTEQENEVLDRWLGKKQTAP